MDIGESFEFLYLMYKLLNVNILHYDYIGYGLAKEIKLLIFRKKEHLQNNMYMKVLMLFLIF
jgi:hypothetical protein